MDLTPQETEQLSQYASDDRYVQRQKEDIQELTSIFRNLIDNADGEESVEVIEKFKQSFSPQPGFRAVYRIIIEGRKKHLIIKVENADLQCSYGTVDHADVELQLNSQILDDIIYARMTFQRAFMSGVTKLKGDFKVLRTLDHIFVF
ncbi:SCP-2 sterol transfer family protein [Kineothrix alysoides]|uniref:SCP-2 sterol transfer family protein n=1 Tax=Kineothrix alysoides TaxID=1469948 RepID=A0A4R1QKU4_9FIRM|nr:SCP2 sterol-binding domain-containing protein [Kineothrix alysoides]TCL54289.1 SCP-2 sterol transfer family protein [Kineothrix alysoides]